MTSRRALALLAATALATACGSGAELTSGVASTTEAPTTTRTASTTEAPTTAAPAVATTAAVTAPPATAAAGGENPPAPATSAPAPPVPATTAAAPAPYPATIAEIDEATRARMSHSWRPGCPVGLEDLRLLTLPHWDEAGRSVTGELVVHADAAAAVVEAFRRLYAAGFPIARMELVDVYGGDDDASMRANNTSAFNCREVAGQPGTWSRHAYGRAVDVNPLVNPWVRGSQVDPPEGAPYADRSVRVPGGIYAGDAAVAAFAAVGWEWGGNWSSAKDYQHFSADGR